MHKLYGTPIPFTENRVSHVSVIREVNTLRRSIPDNDNAHQSTTNCFICNQDPRDSFFSSSKVIDVMLGHFWDPVSIELALALIEHNAGVG